MTQHSCHPSVDTKLNTSELQYVGNQAIFVTKLAVGGAKRPHIFHLLQSDVT